MDFRQEKDWFSLDKQARDNRIQKATLEFSSNNPGVSVERARAHAIRSYAEDRLELTLGKGWEDHFNKDHGQSSSDTMIENLVQAIALGDSKDLKAINDHLTRFGKEEGPHGEIKNPAAVFGYLICDSSDTREKFRRTKYGPVADLKKGVKEISSKSLAHIALGYGLSAVSTLLFPAAPAFVITVPAIIAITIAYGLWSYSQMENTGLKDLQDHNNTDNTPLRAADRDRILTPPETREGLARKSFQEMQEVLHGLNWKARRQLVGLSPDHLRDFVDQIKLEQAPDASKKDRSVLAENLIKKMSSHAAFQHEIQSSSSVICKEMLLPIVKDFLFQGVGVELDYLSSIGLKEIVEGVKNIVGEGGAPEWLYTLGENSINIAVVESLLKKGENVVDKVPESLEKVRLDLHHKIPTLKKLGEQLAARIRHSLDPVIVPSQVKSSI